MEATRFWHVGCIGWLCFFKLFDDNQVITCTFRAALVISGPGLDQIFCFLEPSWLVGGFGHLVGLVNNTDLGSELADDVVAMVLIVHLGQQHGHPVFPASGFWHGQLLSA